MLCSSSLYLDIAGGGFDFFFHIDLFTIWVNVVSKYCMAWRWIIDDIPPLLSLALNVRIPSLWFSIVYLVIANVIMCSIKTNDGIKHMVHSAIMLNLQCLLCFQDHLYALKPS